MNILIKRLDRKPGYQLKRIYNIESARKTKIPVASAMCFCPQFPFEINHHLLQLSNLEKEDISIKIQY